MNARRKKRLNGGKQPTTPDDASKCSSDNESIPRQSQSGLAQDVTADFVANGVEVQDVELHAPPASTAFIQSFVGSFQTDDQQRSIVEGNMHFDILRNDPASRGETMNSKRSSDSESIHRHSQEVTANFEENGDDNGSLSPHCQSDLAHDVTAEFAENEEEFINVNFNVSVFRTSSSHPHCYRPNVI